MDEKSGSVLQDISGNGYNGTLISGSRGNGVRSGALSFNGGSNRATLPVAPFNSLAQEVTISVWLKGGDSLPDSTTLSENTVVTPHGGILSSIFYGSDGGRVYNAHAPWNDTRVYWDAVDRLRSGTANDEAIKGQWNHWVFTKNTSLGEMNVFLNGELFSSGTGGVTPLRAISSFTLGAQSANTRAYDGEIDDFILFNYSLDQEQVSALFNSYANDLEYSNWTSSFTSLTDNATDADPDGDGLPTLVEYVLETDPTLDDSQLAPALSGTDSSATFSYRRKEDGSAFSTNQIVQVSDDLLDWRDMWVDSPAYPDSVSISPLEDRFEEVSVTPTPAFLNAEGLDANAKLFFRLKVEL